MKVRTLVIFALGVLPLFAADWPQWRGTARDGVATSFHEPAAWPARLTRKWKIIVGQGHSSPIYTGGKIFVFSRQQDREVLSSVNPEDGKVLWSQSYAAPYKMNQAAVRHGEGPKSTPVFAGGKLYTLGISGILSCFDAASGAVRWRKHFSSPLYGTAMSPVVDRGLLIAHVGGEDGGALMAFDANTGDVRWSWKGDGPGYAAPLIVELAGARQVVTQSQKNIVGVDAGSGALLWKIPFTTSYEQNIVTPVAYKDTLILSGLGKGTMAVTVTKAGPKEIWKTEDVSMYMSSPVLHGDLLLGFSHKNKGQFFCLDAATGATKWIGEPRQGDNAAIVIGGATLFLLKDNGELILARASAKGFAAVRRYTVADSPTWAHPLILDGGVVIKDVDSLALWSW